MLATGLISHNMILFLILAARPARMLIALTSTYSALTSILLELLAYMLIAVGYHEEIKKILGVPLIPVGSISINVLPRTIGVVLLFYITTNQFLACVRVRERGSLLLLVAFISILVSYVMHLHALLLVKSEVYIISRCINFIGFLILLYIMHYVIHGDA